MRWLDFVDTEEQASTQTMTSATAADAITKHMKTNETAHTQETTRATITQSSHQ